MTGADDDCSLGGAFEGQIGRSCGIAHILGILLMNSCNTVIFLATTQYNLQSVHFVGHLNIILALEGGNLNDPIFKSSNAQALPGGRGGVGVSS